MSRKKLFILVVPFLMIFDVQAQTIHWITSINTKDSSIGNMGVNERRLFYNYFVNIVNKDLSSVGYKTEIHDLYDDFFTTQRCIDTITKLHCDSTDIVVFYYSGYGLHAANEVTPYPSLVIESNAITDAIPLSWVHHELKSKQPRLVITIGECCNNEYQNVYTNKEGYPVTMENRLSKERTSMNFKPSPIQKAFLGNKGEIILSAASLGQSAIGGLTSIGNTGWLTAAFITCFEKMSDSNQFSWADFLVKVMSAVKEMTDGEQVPLYHYDLCETFMSEN